MKLTDIMHVDELRLCTKFSNLYIKMWPSHQHVSSVDISQIGTLTGQITDTEGMKKVI